MKSIIKHINLSVLALFVALAGMVSCSDEPLAENFYTKKGLMVSDYLDENAEQYSDFVAVLKKSGMYGMMATYGSYTCFAPTNQAMREYATSHGFSSAADMPKDICDTIAWNHIIKGAYFTGDLFDGNIPTANMNERYLTFSCDSDATNGNNIVYLINKASKLIVRDDSVENGVVHTLDRVIVPSNNYLPGLLEMDSTISIFYEAMKLTNLTSLLYEYIDTTYHISPDSVYKPVNFPRLGGSVNGGEDHFGHYVGTRMKRFTAFVEQDSTYNKHGIYNIKDLKDYAKKIYDEVFPEDADKYDSIYTDRRNPLNRFVSYHLLPYYGGYQDWTLCDMNGVNLRSECAMPNLIDLTDWYTTLMPNTVMKISSPSEGLFINRRGVGSNYVVRGVRVFAPSESGDTDNQALNGIYHYIDDVLTYDAQTIKNVFDDRIRVSAITMSPEFMNCGARGKDEPTGFKIIDGWQFYGKTTPTISVRNRNVWNATYGDCIDVLGPLDIAFKLPPVPTNTYEIRFAYGARNQGGVVQIYFGTKDNMQPMGIPIDFRVYGGDPNIGWVEDVEDEPDLNRSIDKAMHNRGYLKEMDSWKQGNTNILRANAGKLRRILTTQTMENGTEYWIRMKLVSDTPGAETPINYFELCPKSVYAGLEQEDTH